MNTTHACLTGALVATLLTAGCSSSVSGSKVSASPTAFPSTSGTAAPSSGGGATSAATAAPSPTGSAASAGLTAALLATGDIKGFTAAPDDSTPSPLPCTPQAPPLETQVPAAERAGAVLTSATKKSQLTEDLYRFADVATASRFVTVAERGFSCTTAKIGGMSATISKPGTLTTTTPTDTVIGWDVVITGGTYATAVLVRTGVRVAAFTFEAVAAGRQEIVPATVVDLALKKLTQHS